jgi:hypothetical protein
MIVRVQKPLIIQNKCGATFDEELLKSAILWFADRPVTSAKTVYMHGRYPAVSIHDKKHHIHRLIYQYANRCMLPSHVHVHHIDGDRMNCNLDNLRAMDAPKHLSKHNAGRCLTSEHRMKLSEANRRRKGMKHRKRVDIPLGVLRRMLAEERSILSIANHFGCDWSTIKARIHDNPGLLGVED